MKKIPFLLIEDYSITKSIKIGFFCFIFYLTKYYNTIYEYLIKIR